jgi:glycosyltransferase involved in cell wall biosynthesis
MRILFLNHNLVGRGSYLRCLPLAKQLVGKGHEVTLISCADTTAWHWKEVDEAGVTVLLTPRLAGVGIHDGGYAPLDILARLPFGLRGWDLIHAFEHRPNVSFPAWLGHLRGTPLISDWSDWWTRGGITTSRRRWGWIDRGEAVLLEEGMKRVSDSVTVVSQALWNRARSIGIPEDRLSLIPSGCDHERIPLLDKRDCRRHLHLPMDNPVLCFSGFAFWDYSFLLEAFSRVLQIHPTAILMVVGLDKDGALESITRMCLGPLSSQVRMLGRVDPSEISVPLGAADVHLLPLPDNPVNRARWPIKFGDYLCSGRPLVVSRVGDTIGWLEKAEAGLVCDPSPEGMAEAILQLLADPLRTEKMGRNARILAEGELSWSHQGDRLEAHYNQCLGKCGK